MFNIYNNAPGKVLHKTRWQAAVARTSPVQALVRRIRARCGITRPSARNAEWLITGRVDQNLGASDKAFAHFRMDRGIQASYTDPLDPLFNITSFQPQYEGQLQEVHTLGPNTVNSFNLNASYYRAIFDHPDPTATLGLQPVEVSFAGSALFTIGRNYSLPSGSRKDAMSHNMALSTI